MNVMKNIFFLGFVSLLLWSCSETPDTSTEVDAIASKLAHLSILSELESQLDGIDLSEIGQNDFSDFQLIHSKAIQESGRNSVVYLVYESTDCNTCFEGQLRNLRNKPEYDNVILLGVFNLKRDHTIFVNRNEMDGISLGNESLRKHPIPMLDEHQLSYYLEVGKDYKVHSIHFPMKEFPDISRTFLNSRHLYAKKQ